MTNTDLQPMIYQTLSRLEMENAALRQTLAQHEFRQLERELSSGAPFALEVHAPGAPTPAPPLLPGGDDPALPRLPVPMGSFFGGEPGIALPVIAVHDDGLTGARLAAALLGLITTQYRSPFARLLFLCSSPEAIPFLGRYGLIADWIGEAAPAGRLDRLYRRYGATQIRSLGSGAVIARWVED